MKERLNELEQLYGQYNTYILCEALDVDRGTFLNHIKRNKKQNAWYVRRREKLKTEILQIFEDNREIYGPQKIAVILQRNGERVSPKYVRSIMQEMGLSSVRTDAKAVYERKQKRNILQRQFHDDHPNAVG